MEFVDYYQVMGVAEDASAEDIKRAYRKLARKYHPDVSKEEDSEAQFKKVAEAYQVLKDADRRAEYDELKKYGAQRDGGFTPPPGWQSHAGFGAGDFSGPGAGGFSDFFEELFGQKAYASHSHSREAGFAARGQDVHSRLDISLKDAFIGSTLPVNLGKPTIHSDGSIRTEKRTVNIKIPKGVVNGQTIRLRGQGGPGVGNAPDGDLYIELGIKDDDVFHLDGKNVTLSLPITPWEAALGVSVDVPTLAGRVKLTIPPNSNSGRKLRLKGRGLSGEPPGDQFVVLEIVVPPAQSDEQKKFYKKMSELWSYNPRDKMGAGYE